MSDNIKQRLTRAKRKYQTKKYDDAEKIYRRIYETQPEKLDLWDKKFYSLTLYHLHVETPKKSNEVANAVKRISELSEQENLSKKEGLCIYTLSIIKLMEMYIKQGKWNEIIKWSEKLNPLYLSKRKPDITYKNDEEIFSDKEKYYNYTTLAYLSAKEYKSCLKLAKKGLNEIRGCKNYVDLDLKWRIAISAKKLGMTDESNNNLKSILNTKNDWKVLNELADNYHKMGKNKEARDYAYKASVAPGEIEDKIRVYKLLEILFRKENPDLAMKYAYLVYSIQLYSGMNVAKKLERKIEEAGFEPGNMKFWKVEKQIREYWDQQTPKPYVIKYGRINRMLPHGHSGFIQADDNREYYCTKTKFKGDPERFKQGIYVKFNVDETLLEKEMERQTDEKREKIEVVDLTEISAEEFKKQKNLRRNKNKKRY